MMRYIQTKKLLIFGAAVIFSFALFAAGCGGGDKKGAALGTVETSVKSESGISVLGEGKTKFAFSVTDKEENETQFEIHTDKETVGEALSELGLIEGEDSEYGLYVKTVNGITADYDKDGVYWAFYINGEYASTGVDSTKIVEADSYAFKIEK